MASNTMSRLKGTYSRVLAPRPSNLELSADMNLETEARNMEDALNQKHGAKRRRIACKSCRQAKLRCEDSIGSTRSCQRCRDLSRPCLFDTEHKCGSKRATTRCSNRSPRPPDDLSQARQEAASHSDQDRQVEISNDQDPNSILVAVARSLTSEGPQHFTATPTAPGRRLLDIQREEILCTDPSEQPLIAQYPRTVNSVTLSPTEIQHFFNVYFSCYNPSLPVINPPSSIDAVYDASPLLFWTIVITASRHDMTDLSLLESLMPGVQNLLWSTIAKPPHILPSLQAMCILCIWPLPASSWSQDIAFLLGGVLKTAALQAGLHRPEVFAHFSRAKYFFSPAEVSVAARVWCCIYVAIEGVALMMGQPPYISADRTVEQASGSSNQYQLPETVHHATMVQVFRNKVHSAMAAVERSENSAFGPKRGSSLRSLEVDLQSLERQLGRDTSYRTRADLLSACLQLRGYWFLESAETPCRREGILRAYDTAIDLITHLDSGDKDGYPLKYLTLSSSMVCFAAGALISKVIHSSYSPLVDIERGKHSFSLCINIFRQCSVEDNDMPGRASRILAQAWGVHHGLTQDCQQPPRLMIVARMFFSIVHDSLWLWREKYGGQGAPPLPPPFMPKALSEVGHAMSPTTSTTQSDSATPARPRQSSAGHAVSPTADLDVFIPNGPGMSLTGELMGASVNEELGLNLDDGLFNQGAMSFDGMFPALDATVDDLLWAS